MKYSLGLREPFSAASHLAGAIAGIFGAAYLLSCSDGSITSLTAILVYSVALVSLFLVSGLFHGLHCSDSTIRRLERLDYAAIYFFIAGTYTPICLFVIEGWLGLGLLVGEWVLAFTGALLAIYRGPASRNMQVGIYLAMGWAFLFALPSLSRALAPMPFNLLIVGGIIYSLGAIIFAFNWESLFRTRCSAHDFWHMMVLLASGTHYLVIAEIMY